MTIPVTSQVPPTQVADPVSQTMQKLLKPGSKTTEFLAMVAVYAGALATLLGAFNTSSSRFNAILKIGALVAAAVSQMGYALSRGNTKAALGSLASVLAKCDVIQPAPRHAAAPTDSQAGSISLGELGMVLLVLGAMLAIVFSGVLLLLITGLIVAVIGFVLVLRGASFTGRHPL